MEAEIEALEAAGKQVVVAVRVTARLGE